MRSALLIEKTPKRPVVFTPGTSATADVRRIHVSGSDGWTAAPVEAASLGDSREDVTEESMDLDMVPAPGAFLGLRAALIFNIGAAVAGLIAYEAWSLLMH